jgi:hypothetical protein
VRLTISSCEKKFVENLQRKKNARRGQGSMICGATDDDDDERLRIRGRTLINQSIIIVYVFFGS